jgi:hypothetical protein
MSQACPLLFRQIDGTVARINAFSVIVLVSLSLYTSQTIWLYLLGADFLIRLYGLKSFSPVNRLSMWIKQLFGLETKMTDAGAKRLAAHFGVAFVILLLISTYMQLDALKYALGALFLLCASLELLFDYCVGCKIYFLLKKIYPRF